MKNNAWEYSVGELISQHITKENSIAVGVSGGKDSMCLLHYLINCAGVDNERITVVHINHGIRENAMLDQEFVEKFCADNELQFKAFSVDIPKLCLSTGRGVEHEAREARLGIFSRLTNVGGVDMVLTAHHQDDLAESVLMHLFRGCGISGLVGMEAYSNQSKIFRPFLYVSKQQIDGYVVEHGVPYRDDESNFDDKYDRNYLRLKVLPLICKRWSGAVDNIAALSRRAAIEDGAAESLLNMDWIGSDEEDAILYHGAFDSPLVARYIFKCLKLFGVECDIEQRHIDLIVDLWRNHNNGSRLDLPHNLTAIREYDKVRFSQAVRMKSNDLVAYDGAMEYCLGEAKIAILPTSIATATQIIEQCLGAKLSNSCDKVLAADFDKIPFDCVIRYRRDGDIFMPYGGGRKKLKNYFIDRKIPQSKRDKIPCLCYNNEILVVVGEQISEKIKIDSSTVNPVKITYRREK